MQAERRASLGDALFTLRDHKIVAMRMFPERAQALEAAGRSE